MSNSIVFLENYVESKILDRTELLLPDLGPTASTLLARMSKSSTSVPGAASLPPELTRILATVRDLDERSWGMLYLLHAEKIEGVCT